MIVFQSNLNGKYDKHGKLDKHVKLIEYSDL